MQREQKKAEKLIKEAAKRNDLVSAKARPRARTPALPARIQPLRALPRLQLLTTGRQPWPEA